MPARQPRQPSRAAAAYTPAATPPIPPTVPAAPPPGDPRDGDGIRWDLVDRMRALVAADALDTPDRWVIAEELLFGEMLAKE